MTTQDMYVIVLQALNQGAETLMIEIEDRTIIDVDKDQLQESSWFWEHIDDIAGRAVYLKRRYTTWWEPSYTGHFQQMSNSYVDKIAIVDAVF